ncbi:MAG: TetR/AcrR family transcriptional regulator [Phycisphaerales bacterium JB041]
MREQVLDAAEEMVQERGLAAVSFQQLADAVGLSKASVFHHFPSKEAVAEALVDRCQSKYGPAYGAVIDSDLTAPEKLVRIAAIFEQGLRENRLCLLNSLGQSVSTLSESVQADLRLSASRAIDRFARVFEQGRDDGLLAFEGEANDAAAAFLALLEGLQVLARAKRDHNMFERAAKSYIESITT